MLSPVRFDDGALKLLDQTRLPAEESWLECRTVEDVADAIRRLAVRGAPAIGLAAAYGLALGVRAGDGGAPLERFERAAALLGSTRPTAVNLQWAIARARTVAESRADEGTGVTADALLELAERLVGEQREADRRIGELGAALIEAGDPGLTHRNTGPPAAGGAGTPRGGVAPAGGGGRPGPGWGGGAPAPPPGSRPTPG